MPSIFNAMPIITMEPDALISCTTASVRKGLIESAISVRKASYMNVGTAANTALAPDTDEMIMTATKSITDFE